MEETKPLFRVSNHHVADSGTPPYFDGDAPNTYYGYFMNAFGEQLVFEYNRESKEAKLWHGDARWDRPYLVMDGKAPGLNLAEEEKLWLRACWLAVQPPM